MSTILGNISTIDGNSKDLQVSRFYGGELVGSAIQLSIATEYVQLDREHVKMLVATLNLYLEENK